MIDLHLHLDGSLPPKLLLKLAQMEGISLPADTEQGLIPFLTAPKDCQSLNQFLEKFELPLSCMQSAETLCEGARGLTEDLAEQGLIYAEIRFAPQLHKEKGLTQSQAIEAVIHGMEKGCEGTSLRTGLILCCMRGDSNQEENLETVRLAGRFLGKGVCGVDLAGAEGLFPTRDYAGLFALARELHIPITIHAGEADGPESVRAALSFGAKRIGHGIRVAEDPALLEEIRKKGIFLETCITSNFQTKAVSGKKEHPALSLLRQGILVTVNTDDMTVCGTTMSQELNLLKQQGMTGTEERMLFENAIKGSFVPEEEKERLISLLHSRLPLADGC